jgi:hypothetical protein
MRSWICIPRQSRVSSFATALLLVTLLLNGCGRTETPLPSTPVTSHPEATPLPAPGTPLVMPRPSPQGTVAAERLTAKITGRLTKTDECFRVGGLTIAWPPDIMVTMDGDVLHVVGMYGLGQRWDFSINEQVTMGGGEIRPAFVQEFEELRISPTCPSPYWLFGGSMDRALTPTPR